MVINVNFYVYVCCLFIYVYILVCFIVIIYYEIIFIEEDVDKEEVYKMVFVLAEGDGFKVMLIR